MSEQGAITIVGLILGFLGTVFAAVMAYLMSKIKEQGVAAAIKVEEVSVKTEQVAAKVEETSVAATVARSEIVRQVAENTAITADVNHKTDDLIKKTDQVVDLTNGHMTAVKAELESALKQILELKEQVAKLTQ